MVCILLARVPHFNSQPHKEADFDMLEIPFAIESFQLTASQGG